MNQNVIEQIQKLESLIEIENKNYSNIKEEYDININKHEESK
jgi:hypothetical protein